MKPTDDRYIANGRERRRGYGQGTSVYDPAREDERAEGLTDAELEEEYAELEEVPYEEYEADYRPVRPERGSRQSLPWQEERRLSSRSHPDYTEMRGISLEPEKPALKVVRVFAAFIAIFTIVYLLSNNLGDAMAENEAFTETTMAEAFVVTNPPPTPPPVAAAAYDPDIPFLDELLELTDEYPAIYNILNNAWDYPEKLLELVVKNNETVDFVADYPVMIWETSMVTVDISISGEVSEDSYIPLFIQWDSRWGYTLYGTEIMGLDACGPTALSMVAVGLTGDTRYNPRFVADFAQENGYITTGNSTMWTLMSEGSAVFGLSAKELMLDANAIINALRRGEPIIASMGPGDFTQGGHFIVLVGVTDDGMILIKDPNSRGNTEAEWDVKRLMSQMKNLWVFTKK